MNTDATKIARIIDWLACPDDGDRLEMCATGLSCVGCGRRFVIHDENFVELLPLNPTALPGSISGDYRDGYLAAFLEEVRDNPTDTAWGAEEVVSSLWLKRKQRQVQSVFPLLRLDGETENLLLCDIAAGAGYYTFAYAPYFLHVFHCDLSVANLNYARRKARERNLKNICFIRADYFRPPFRQSLNRLLCFDTIIRGPDHDRLLLQSIAQVLAPDGKAVVDFHNWWHNPLRRLGLLKENFVSNKSYSRRSAESLLAEAGIKRFNYSPFHQEGSSRGTIASAYVRVLPATRLIYSFDCGN